MNNNNLYTQQKTKQNINSPIQTRNRHGEMAHSTLPQDFVKRDNPILNNNMNYQARLMNSKSIDQLADRQANIDQLIRQINDKVNRIAGKLSKHEEILIKITENSIQNNKEGYRQRNDKMKSGDIAKFSENWNQQLTNLRKDFEEYKSGNINTKQIEIKNKLFSQLIYKSQERMKEQMQSMINQMTNDSLNSHQDLRKQQSEKSIKRMQKNIIVNTSKINQLGERIQTINSSIEGNLELMNIEVNKAISKIVAFINQKVSKPIHETINQLTTKIQFIQKNTKDSFSNYQSSNIRSNQFATRADYREILSIHSSEIIVSERVYYIDVDGYLLDQNYFYLTDSKSQRIKLDEKQITSLANQNMIN